MCSVLKQIGRRGLSRIYRGCIFFVVLLNPVSVFGAAEETEVGVTAASNISAVGQPPVSPARDLETGLEVFFSENIKTDFDGRAQLLFLDGTTLTIGAGSEMVIDEYIYDPASGTGEMAVSLSKGVFRLVGGKISKKKAIKFSTPAATIAVRGGIATFAVQPPSSGASATDVSALQATLFYGNLSVTSGGTTVSTFQPGRFIEVPSQNAQPKPAKIVDQATLNSQLKSLEKSSKPREDKTASDDAGGTQAADQSREESSDEPEPASGAESEDQGGQSKETKNEEQAPDRKPDGEKTDQNEQGEDRSAGPEGNLRSEDVEDEPGPPRKDTAGSPPGDDADKPRENDAMRVAKARDDEPPGPQPGDRKPDDDGFNPDDSNRRLTPVPGTEDAKSDEFFEKEASRPDASKYLTDQEREKFDAEKPDLGLPKPPDPRDDHALIDHEGQGELPEKSGFFTRMMSAFGIDDKGESPADDEFNLTGAMGTLGDSRKDDEPLPVASGGAGTTADMKDSAVARPDTGSVAPATTGDWTPDMLSKEDHEKFDRAYDDLLKGGALPAVVPDDGEYDPELGTYVIKSRSSTESMAIPKLDRGSKPDDLAGKIAITDMPKSSAGSTEPLLVPGMDTPSDMPKLETVTSPASYIAVLTKHFGEETHAKVIDSSSLIDIDHDHHRSHEMSDEVTEVSKETTKGETGTLAPITVVTTSAGEKAVVVTGDADKVFHAAPGAKSDIKVYSVDKDTGGVRVAKMSEDKEGEAGSGTGAIDITCTGRSTDGHCYEYSDEKHPSGPRSSLGHKDDDGEVGKDLGGEKKEDTKGKKDECDPRIYRCEEDRPVGSKDSAKDDRKTPESGDSRKGEPRDVRKEEPRDVRKEEPKYEPKVADVKTCDPKYERCRARSPVATLVWSSGDQLGFGTDVMGAPFGSWADSRQITHLCSECRFLDWGRFTRVSSTPDSSRIRYWLAGATATAAQMAAAADKTAIYSGGMMGAVVRSGQMTEHQGSFQSQVQFGLTHYQVNTFNATFDGMHFSGSGGRTGNAVPFGVTATSHYEALNESRLHTLSGQGYFFGSSEAGQPPPEMGGHFQITGDNYQAGGVFAGGRD